MREGLPDLLDTIRWRWLLVLLVALGVLGGAIAYSESLPAEYQAQTVVALAPRPDSPASPDTVRLVAPKYVAYLTSPATIEDVARQSGADPGEAGDALDASIASDSGNLTITVTMLDPDTAARLANDFADSAVDYAAGDELILADLVAPALADPRPSGPPRRLLQAAALLVGIMLGVTLALFVERIRPRVRTWREMHRITGFPILGRIPYSRSLRRSPLTGLSDPAVGAAFRTLRTNLEHEWKDRTVDFIVVTSPTKGDGKTTVAALFAESLARLGAHTLLIDGDMRRPGLSNRFADGQSPGLVDVLKGQAALAGALQPGWVPDLQLMSTDRDPKASDILITRFPGIIQKARGEFDVIVVDSPPLEGSDEAHAYATLANGVLLVVAAGTDTGPLQEATLALQTLRAQVLGVVANRVRESHTYYG